MSHQAALPGPPAITHMSLSRNDSSTAFLSHWLTRQDSSASLLGDARLAAIEQVERGLDGLAHRPLGRGSDAVALLERLIDGAGELGMRHDTLVLLLCRGGAR